MISPYNKDIPATHPKVISPVICNAPMIASLRVGTTAIAESTMSRFGLYTTGLISNTTICGMRFDLSVVKCRLLFDLLFDDSKCVHLFTPKRMGELTFSALAGSVFPFLQSFASHIHSGVDSFTVSINSTFTIGGRLLFLVILSIIASDC